MPIADDLLINFAKLFELQPNTKVEYNFNIFNDKSVMSKFNLNESDLIIRFEHEKTKFYTNRRWDHRNRYLYS